jgi:hypothetical protein
MAKRVPKNVTFVRNGFSFDGLVRNLLQYAIEKKGTFC